MSIKDFLASLSRKFILIVSGIVVAIIIVFFIWQKNKYRIVNETLANKISEKTNGLYRIAYDSLYFDEIAGKASMKNIHISPDTMLVKSQDIANLPYVLLDIRIASLRVSGVRTDKALLGKQMIGDSIIIDHVDVTIYFVKPLQKHTRIQKEVNNVYEEILGNLEKIQVGNIFINNVNVKGEGFFTKERDFDVLNSKIQLTDVLVDSAHTFDTSRTLFCRRATLEVPSFVTYNNNRPELRVTNMAFSGKDKLLSFKAITLNRFEDKDGDSARMLHADSLVLRGLNTNEMVNNKNIIMDTITCKNITLYEPPVNHIKSPATGNIKPADSSGFRHVYSIDMRHLDFPAIRYIPNIKDGFSLGNIAVKINEVKAAEIINVEMNPIDYCKEAEIACDRITINSKDGFYKYNFRNTVLNSLQKQLKIAGLTIKPFLDEESFGNKAHFQKDRYDVDISGIAMKNIDMKNLLAHKIIASDLAIIRASVKIFTDLQRPQSGKSKIGNYPSQLVGKIGIPVSIRHVSLANTLFEYREKEIASDSTGDAKFTGSFIDVSNVTNMPEVIQHNNTMSFSFRSKAFDSIPVKGNFTFMLNNNAKGNFTASGNIAYTFDARVLNDVAIPMSLIRFSTGSIHSLDFNFTGDDLGASGDFMMKYNDFKVDVLKRDKNSRQIKKKGLTSLAANVIVTNGNPHNGKLRSVKPHFDRDIQKSFFNLIWKTIFTGIKKTVGLP